MATNDELIKKIEGKFKMLKFTQDNTPRVLERNKPRDLERQLKVFEDQSDQVLQLIVEVKEKRIQEGDEIDEIQAWSLDIEKRLEEFDEKMDLLRKAIESLNEQTVREGRQIEQKMEDQRRKTAPRDRNQSRREEIGIAKKIRKENGRKPIQIYERGQTKREAPQTGDNEVPRYAPGLAKVLKPIRNRDRSSRNWANNEVFLSEGALGTKGTFGY